MDEGPGWRRGALVIRSGGLRTQISTQVQVDHALHHVTQLLTGHGSFKFKLHTLGLIEDPHCNCHQPAEDTVQHVLYTCTKYNAFRRPLQEVVQIKDVVWPPELRFWATKDAYPVVRKYIITRVLRLREEEELRRRLQAG